jgi:hypothetical protein
VLYSSQDHLGTGTHNLDHPVLAVVENTDSWRYRKGALQCGFPLDVLMVTSSKLSFIANNNNSASVGLALSETIRFDSLEFTVDHLGRLSLSPYEGDSIAIFIGMVHGRSPSLHTTLKDSSDEGGATSGTGGGGSYGSPAPEDATW